MTKTVFNLRRMIAGITICLAGMTVFASCDKDLDPQPLPDNGANIVSFTFTGIKGTAIIDKDALTVTATAAETVDLASIVATFTLSDGATATVNDIAQVSGTTANNFTNTVTYIVTSSDNRLTNIWKVTIIDEAETKKYFTYKEPVKVYFIEYNGGTSNLTNSGSIVIFQNGPYDTKKMSELSYDEDWGGWFVHYVFGSELDENLYAKYNLTGNMVWEYPDQPWDDWLTEDYKPYEFPLSDFGDIVSNKKNYTAGVLYEIYDKNPSNMPDNVDVSDWYVRSEKVMDIMCDVFKTEYYHYEYTFWVDLSTGLTLKYIRLDTNDNTTSEYEVTKLVFGFTNLWGELHLCPGDGDVIKPGF